MFIGMNVTFFPMHVDRDCSACLGACTPIRRMAAGMASTWRRRSAWVFLPSASCSSSSMSCERSDTAHQRENPWDAPTLEWSVSSPPPPYNFAVMPTVHSAYPLWEGRLTGGEVSLVDRGPVLDDGRETIETTGSRCRTCAACFACRRIRCGRCCSRLPSRRWRFGLLASSWTWVAIALGLVLVTLTGWLRPSASGATRALPRQATQGVAPLAREPNDARGPGDGAAAEAGGRWAMRLLVLTEACFLPRSSSLTGTWPPSRPVAAARPRCRAYHRAPQYGDPPRHQWNAALGGGGDPSWRSSAPPAWAPGDVRTGRGVHRASGTRIESTALHAAVRCVRLAVLHDHGISRRTRHRRPAHEPGRADLALARGVQPGPPWVRVQRRSLLALRGCRLAVRVHVSLTPFLGSRRCHPSATARFGSGCGVLPRRGACN